MKKIDLTDERVWDAPMFPVAVAAEAALMEAGTLRIWFVRGNVTLHQMDYHPDSGGLPRLLTLRSVLQLAVTAQLARKGIKVADAFAAAKNWVHLGDGWDGNGPSPRDPACLYPDPDYTVLVHYTGDHARVARVKVKEGMTFAFRDLFNHTRPLPDPPTIIFLNQVDRQVRTVCTAFLNKCNATQQVER